MRLETRPVDGSNGETLRTRRGNVLVKPVAKLKRNRVRDKNQMRRTEGEDCAGFCISHLQDILQGITKMESLSYEDTPSVQ